MEFVLTDKKAKVYNPTAFFRKAIKEVPVAHQRFNKYKHGLFKEYVSSALMTALEKSGIEIPKDALEDTIFHIIPPPNWEEKFTKKMVFPTVTKEDELHYWHILFPLVAIPTVLKRGGDIATLAAKLAMSMMHESITKRIEGHIILAKEKPPEKIPEHDVQILSVFDEFENIVKTKVKRDRLVEILLETYGKHYEVPIEKARELIESAIDAAYVLGKAKAKDNFIHDRIANVEDKEFERYLNALKEVLQAAGVLESTKPKFPQVQKQVEEELKARGVPEEQVKVIAPRLATAVWLENQIRALKESSFAKIAGGVPASELRALKEKILAKKHVAEKASELVEKEWMRGNIVSVKEEEHLDKKLLPLVKEHAAGMLEDIKALAERVKRGELDAQDVRTILAVKRDLLDRTHEAVERTLGNPEHLMENKRAWGAEDKFLIKKEALEKMHEELKPHFETARVRICIKTEENVPEEL
ncbi:MAG: hypothetical protein PWQ79_2177 [Thermococcaceae archaeon]|nr:hypothetical protein [Thermococcaceae archaeon]MDK2915262.1 hypothetical protein [Thermococcaceae archaeon]